MNVLSFILFHYVLLACSHSMAITQNLTFHIELMISEREKKKTIQLTLGAVSTKAKKGTHGFVHYYVSTRVTATTITCDPRYQQRRPAPASASIHSLIAKQAEQWNSSFLVFLSQSSEVSCLFSFSFFGSHSLVIVSEQCAMRAKGQSRFHRR